MNDYASAEVTSREEFMELVLAERYKEFWGEGQTFFSYKRENKGFKHPDSWDHYGEVYTLRLKCLYCLGRKKNWNLVELIKTDRYEKEYIISDFYLTGNFNSRDVMKMGMTGITITRIVFIFQKHRCSVSWGQSPRR